MSDDTNPTANAAATGRSGVGGDFSTGLRLGLAAALGQSGYDRNRYDVFGWTEEPKPDEYYGLYLRNPYAYAAVAQKASTTWRGTPEIVDGTHPEDVEPSDKELTAFEQRVKALAHQKDAWSYADRIDRLAGIGTHGILVLDLVDTNDPDDFAAPPQVGSDAGLDALRGFRVYSDVSIEDIEYGEPGSDRWGMPEYYYIDLREDPVNEDSAPGTQDMIKVHHQRAIDVPSRPLDDDEVHARPRIELVLNVIYDIEKALGAAAELVYAGAKQDIHINFDPEKVNTDHVTDNDEELQDWYHDRNPWIRTVGGEVEQISPPEIVDPTGVIESELKAFSAATDIPQQLLDGSAAGELASASQDERDYFGTISERREQYATPHIVRSLLDRLIVLGILPRPEGQQAIGPDYRVNWPDLTELSEKDVAELRNQRAQIVKRLQGAVPELTGDRAENFVESGEFSERESMNVEPMDLAEERARMEDQPADEEEQEQEQTQDPAQDQQPPGSQPAVSDGGAIE